MPIFWFLGTGESVLRKIFLAGHREMSNRCVIHAFGRDFIQSPSTPLRGFRLSLYLNSHFQVWMWTQHQLKCSLRPCDCIHFSLSQFFFFL